MQAMAAGTSVVLSAFPDRRGARGLQTNINAAVAVYCAFASCHDFKLHRLGIHR